MWRLNRQLTLNNLYYQELRKIQTPWDFCFSIVTSAKIGMSGSTSETQGKICPSVFTLVLLRAQISPLKT